MKKRLFNALMVGLIICSTYVFAFANPLVTSENGCAGNGHWELDKRKPYDNHVCVLGGTECNVGQPDIQ